MVQNTMNITVMMMSMNMKVKMEMKIQTKSDERGWKLTPNTKVRP